MRKVVLGMLLAAGAMLPGIAAAQDNSQDRRPGGERQHDGGGRPDRGSAPQDAQQPRPAAAPQGQPQAQVQGQAQAQAQAGGRFGGDRVPRSFDGNRDGQRQLGGGDRAQAYDRDRGDGGYRGSQGGPGQQFGGDRGGDRFAGRPPVAPGSGDYRPQGGPAFAPGSRGYRPQGGYDRGPGYAAGSGYRPGQPQQGRGGAWNRGWRGDNRYDWGGYRAQNRGAFHLPRYYAPRGWGYGYRRFTPGFTLQSVLFSEDYWIDDAYDYRLPPAYGPYRWVRYYNDALLVDIRSGYVVDTVYDIFW